MLQITNTKVQSRKWADDSEVKDCMGCSKKFSVTIRKVRELGLNLLIEVLLHRNFCKIFNFKH